MGRLLLVTLPERRGRDAGEAAAGSLRRRPLREALR